jgi:ADP-heptose:LPS heptosyltransferase
MGFGDEIMGTGIAKGARARGKRIAFGDGKNIIWSAQAEQIYAGNPNIAPPGKEREPNLEWIAHYGGYRAYHHGARGPRGDRWYIWNFEFRAVPGEIYNPAVRAVGSRKDDIIIIEPNTKGKLHTRNKRWSLERFQKVATHFKKKGFKVIQLLHRNSELKLGGVRYEHSASFINAVARIKRARLLITNDGGLHHAAAATGTAAVVIFGGWAPPQVTGYDFHCNLTGGADIWCGSLTLCQHCKDALDRISVDEVIAASEEQLCRCHSS